MEALSNLTKLLVGKESSDCLLYDLTPGMGYEGEKSPNDLNGHNMKREYRREMRNKASV